MILIIVRAIINTFMIIAGLPIITLEIKALLVMTFKRHVIWGLSMGARHCSGFYKKDNPKVDAGG